MAKPVALIVAAAAFDDDHVTEFVKSCVLLSENVPVALNCNVDPTSTEVLPGVIPIETKVADVTLRPVVPVMVPCLALMVVDSPAPTPVAKPVALIVAAAAFDDDHATELVKSCVLLSENIPVALNCNVDPTSTEVLPGVIPIETKVAEVTLRLVAPDMAPCLAAIVVDWPDPAPVARPVALIVATAAFDDDHVTEFVKSSVLLSENMPVASNCTVRPLATRLLAGVTVIETSTAGVTDSSAVPIISPEDACIVAVPTPVPVATPVALIDTVAELDDVQDTECKGVLVPSE